MEDHEISWNYYVITRKDHPGHYKMGTHEVRKSGFLRVDSNYEMETHDGRKTLGLRFVKEIQTFGVVIGPHSIVSFG
jgi:hypothetical protein